ncbi:glutamate--cysteine ligase [Methylococcus capsulatus]|uniref:glutamate--cysteine ligase n=1 Tax=Methylococcus capsulatus TaxID=414 RepID=UPI002FD97343
MRKLIDSRLEQLARAGQVHLLRKGLKGLEKESLRITTAGEIARTPHPKALGSALTHPAITTDYSEALIELITPPFEDSADTLAAMEDLHRFVHANIGDELLLATSMPCRIEGDESIPIACYGNSNIGRMKHVYRRGLGYRYGRAMQAIAGVHFNYSVSEELWPVLQAMAADRRSLAEFVADRYFGMVRNIQRFGWLILYLFGSSPALSKSFLAGRETPLASSFTEFDPTTWHRPYATSLRMSDIGYRNDNQASLDISFNRLEDYVRDLSHAISTPYAPYQAIGVEVDGEYRQLNANILQIENEYYSTVRPKQITRSGEMPTLALKKRGVRYLELRSVDLNCYHPAGISLEQLRFLEIFMLLSLLAASPPMSTEEKKTSANNMLATACCGRTPGMTLIRDNTAVDLRAWAKELCESMAPIAAALDGDSTGGGFSAALEHQYVAIANPEQCLPSARMLREMRGNHESFAEFAQRLSLQHAESLRSPPSLPAEKAEAMRRMAETSLAEQESVEAGDSLAFADYLKHYFAQT